MAMGQTKLESISESLINVFSGTLVSFCIWKFIIVPIWEFDSNFVDDVAITAIYTVAAITRSYLWRRFFNKGLHLRLLRRE